MQKSEPTFTRPEPSVLTLEFEAKPGFERFLLVWEGHVVPYIHVTNVTDQWRGYAKEWGGDHREVTFEAHRIARAVRGGERVFNLDLDGRFGHTCIESELFGWTFFLANAMAVSAGYTSHGPSSRRINRHGVSRK
jgi:hypothetical protein